MKSFQLILPSLAFVLVAGCHSLPETPGRHAEILVEGRLAERNPADVAVLPVVNKTGNTAVPLNVIRHTFYKGLVERRYSPINLEFVDRKVVDASYQPGALQEDAALKIYLTEWDDSSWETHRRIGIAADVFLLDSRPIDANQELWGWRVRQEISVAADQARYALEEDLIKLAIQRYTDEVLGGLPLRDPLALPGPQ